MVGALRSRSTRQHACTETSANERAKRVFASGERSVASSNAGVGFVGDSPPMKKLLSPRFLAALAVTAIGAGCHSTPASSLVEAPWCASPRGSLPAQVGNASDGLDQPHDDLVEDVWRSAPRGTAMWQTIRLHASTREPVPHDTVVAPPPAPPAMPVVYTDGGLSRYGQGSDNPH